MYTIGKLPEWHVQKKYITNEDNNIVRVHSMSIILLILMNTCLMRDVLLLLSTILYDLRVK